VSLEQLLKLVSKTLARLDENLDQWLVLKRLSPRVRHLAVLNLAITKIPRVARPYLGLARKGNVCT
jgi:hypothetical protein